MATSTGGIPEAVDPDESALPVPSGDASALGKALDSLLDRPDTWDEMGRHGREYVERNFHIETLNENLVQLSESLLE